MIIEQADLHSNCSEESRTYRVIIEQADLHSNYRTGGLT